VIDVISAVITGNAKIDVDATLSKSSAVIRTISAVIIKLISFDDLLIFNINI
jgi:hypothetical protein